MEIKKTFYSFQARLIKRENIVKMSSSSRWWIGTTDNAKKQQDINNAKRSPNSNKEAGSKLWKFQVFVNFKLLIHGEFAT